MGVSVGGGLCEGGLDLLRARASRARLRAAWAATTTWAQDTGRRQGSSFFLLPCDRVKAEGRVPPCALLVGGPVN